MSSERGGSRGPVDWAHLKRRLEAAGRALTDGTPRSRDHASAVLDERARALARPVADTSPRSGIELVTLAAGGTRYGVDPSRVREMCRAGHVTPLPGAERWIAGLVVWHGDLVQAGDLGVLLGGHAATASERTVMLIVGDRRPRLALLADGPGELEAVPAGDLRPPPADFRGRDFIRAVSSEGVLVLDMDRVIGEAGLGSPDRRS